MRRGIACLVALAAPAAFADLTIHYQTESIAGPGGLPVAATAGLRNQLAAFPSSGTTLIVKGRQCSTLVGPMTYLANGETNEITLFNTQSRKYSTLPAADYAEIALGAPDLPPEAEQALENLKAGATLDKTGRTEVIAGVLTEENLITISLDIPNPLAPANSSAPPISARVEVRQWMPAAAEMDRISGLREMAGCARILGANADPSARAAKVLAEFPGLRDKLAGVVKTLSDRTGGPVLRMELRLLIQLPPGLVPGAPAAAGSFPVLQLSSHVTEVSPAPIPDAAFRVPEGYERVELLDLLASYTPPDPAPPPRPAAPQAPAALPEYTGPLDRPGNGVSNPVPIDRPAPQYPAGAAVAKTEGTVMLSLVIDPDGNPRNIKVVRSLDPAFDQKAIEAASRWKFKPAMRDGMPVAVPIQLQISFKLASPVGTR